MTFLELVQQAMYRAGVRSAVPSTLTGVVDAAADFKRYVNDAWRELQEESSNWWFRQKLDQTLAIVASTDQYAMPAGLESINYRTVSIYTTAKTDETPVTFTHYEDWRMIKDTISTSEGRPTLITQRPDEVLQIWPVPDQAYTLRFDGVWDVDEMEDDADTPGSTITSGSTLLPDRFHWLLVYDAAGRWHEHHENAEGVAEMAKKYRKLRDRLDEKQKPPPYVKAGILTGAYGRRWGQW